jgi:ankyrin repeat protein
LTIALFPLRFFLSVPWGADVNARDLDGKTPLHHTTFHKAKVAAKVLEGHGAV